MKRIIIHPEQKKNETNHRGLSSQRLTRSLAVKSKKFKYMKRMGRIKNLR